MSEEINYCCIHQNAHHSYSDVYASRQRTAYRIGRPDGSPMKMYNVSFEEAVCIVTHLPEELLEVVKNHYKLVELPPEDTAAPEDPAAPDEAPPEIPVDDDLPYDIDSMGVDDLKSLCKSLGITGYSSLNKAELVAALNEYLDAQDTIN